MDLNSIERIITNHFIKVAKKNELQGNLGICQINNISSTMHFILFFYKFYSYDCILYHLK